MGSRDGIQVSPFWCGPLVSHFVWPWRPMANNHETNQIVTLLTATCSTFGRDEAFALVERTLFSVLALPTITGPVAPALEVEPSESCTTLASDGARQKVLGHSCPPKVLGLPDGVKWEPVAPEVKLAKEGLREATSHTAGIVIRREDSPDGDLYFANYSPDDLAFNVPAGYFTSRSKSDRAHHISVNGAYRWVIVGAVAVDAVGKTKAARQAKGPGIRTLPVWRGRSYESCHEEMAHLGNVRVGTLLRDIRTKTLDYVAACDGTTALIERENGDLDDIRVTAHPSKLLRVVGFSSQYAAEVASRG